MNIQLSDHFTYKKLLRFTLPSIVMMVFSSIYGVVDGIFVSNFAGETEFSALNFIFPFIMMLGAFGFMFGTGGSALISKTMGEGDHKKARILFSLIVYVSVAVGVVLAMIGFVLMRPIASLMGAEGELLDDCVLYGRIVILALPAFMLQMEFQSFFVMAEKPQLGLYTTLASGITNMLLDLLLVGVLPWGLAGAATATALSQLVGGVVPIVYFGRENTSLMKLGHTEYDGRALRKTVTNGSSELMSNISMSLVGMLYNIQLMHYAEQQGVAAYGVLMYVNFVFISIFIGYVVGMSPVVSYHYGVGNKDELKNLLRKSLILISVCSVAMLVLSEALAYPFSALFVSDNSELLEMTLRGFRIYSFSFLLSGFALFGSCFFTALNDGLTSAIISFLRILLFQTAAVLILPLIFELDGVWLSIVVAELLAVCVTAVFLITKKKKYGY